MNHLTNVDRMTLATLSYCLRGYFNHRDYSDIERREIRLHAVDQLALMGIAAGHLHYFGVMDLVDRLEFGAMDKAA